MGQGIPTGLLQPLGVGEGWHEVIRGDNPAAAADFTLAMDGRFTSRLLAVSFRLVADANAANRFARVVIEDAAGNVLAATLAGTAQTANQTIDYSFLANVAGTSVATAVAQVAPLAPIFLRPTDVLRIDNVNAQAGDQLSRVFVTAERFFTDGPR